MRAFRFAIQAACLLLAVTPLAARVAPTISSVSPSSIHEKSGEWFMRISGTNFLPLAGVTVTFSGPSGTVTLNPSAGTDSSLDVWVPQSVVLSAGSYNVTVRATDAQGTVISNAKPFSVSGSSVILKLPQYVLAEALTRAGAVVRFDVSATSQLGDATVKCSRESGELFAIEKTTIDCEGTDEFGGSMRGTFDVTVDDTTPPSFKLPQDLTAFGAKDGARVLFDVYASDAVDGDVKVTCLPESGSLFPVGTSVVRCEAVDSRGNDDKESFLVHVGDDETPALIVPRTLTVEAQAREGTYLQYVATATDAKGNSVPVECTNASGSLFPIGSTTVTCTAKLRAIATSSFDVRVVDTSAPYLRLPRGVLVDATRPDGAYVTFDVGAKDAVDDVVSVSCSPASGSFFASGVTSVNCSANDSSKNVTNGSFNVTVTPYPDDTNYSRSEDDVKPQ
jgi:hypothetical protein